LWIQPCRQVHTLFMRYTIDVVHLDRGGRVIEVEQLSPWRLGVYRGEAASVLELAAGEAARLGLEVGARPTLVESP
jgi:uncharacterized protein